MTKHELAAAKWREIKDVLIERGAFDEAFVTNRRGAVMAADEGEMVDQMVIAMIEGAFAAAVAAVERETENALCKVDSAKLIINKPVNGILTIDSDSFKKGDGHEKIRTDQVIVIRESDSHQVLITRRQG